MIVTNCERLVQVANFIEKETDGSAKSGFLMDFLSRKRHTDAEKLEFRKYMKGRSKPALYTGACLPPKLHVGPEESLTVEQIGFPTIKIEGKISSCDIDERRINPDGTIIPVGIQRFNAALNWTMMGIFDSIRQRQILDVITLLRTGSYVLHSSVDGEQVGVVNYNREAQLSNIDLTGTTEAWSNMCSKPLNTVRDIVKEMRRCKAATGVIDIFYSPLAWEWMEAHDEREAIKFKRDARLTDTFTDTPFLEYDDVESKGTTNGGSYRHWVIEGTYQDHEGNDQDIIPEGEILIVSKQGLDLQRIFRTVTSDNKERLPAGVDLFVYDDLEREYNRKCRSFAPWVELYPLMLPANINGAVFAKVVDPALGSACTICEECP